MKHPLAALCVAVATIASSPWALAQNNSPTRDFACAVTLVNGERSLVLTHSRNANHAAQMAAQPRADRRAGNTPAVREVRQCVPRIGGRFRDSADQRLLDGRPM